MMNPQVSVLMTAYNREKYIEEAIVSVLNSTFQDFELIIVDDCSKDKTLEIIRLYENKDSRIKVYVNEQNLGDYPNRNRAASYANGKYIKYLDSDDIMSVNCLMHMVTEMEKYPSCAFGVSSRSSLKTIVHSPREAFRIHFFERGILDISPSGSIIRNDIFKKEKGFLELTCVSDLEFWMRIALRYHFVEFEKDLIFWREHENQQINNNTPYLTYELNIILEKIELSELSFEEKEFLIKKRKKSTMRFLIKNVIELGLFKTIYFKRINKLSFFDAI